MDGKSRVLIGLVAALLGLGACFSAAVLAAEAKNPGLIGIQYGSEDFEDAEQLVRLDGLDQQWGQADGFGKQWAAKWQGFIIAPVTGQVEFILQTDQEAELRIADQLVVESKRGSRSGTMTMTKGQQYPVVLTYVKEGSQYDCYLKVQWSWAGQQPTVISADNLAYAAQAASELEKVVGAAEDEDEESDSPTDMEEDNDDDDHYEAMGLAPGVRLPDSDVVTLWLFDETDYPHTTITDASEYAGADLCLMDGGHLVKGKFGNALQVTGSDYAVSYAGFIGKLPEQELRERDGTPSGLWGPTEGPEALLNALARQSWTIEFWLNLPSAPTAVTIIDMGQAYDPGLSLRFDAKGFELADHYAGIRATCAITLSIGKWHHLAFTCDGRTVTCFVDGVQKATAAVSSIPRQPLPDLQKPENREHEDRGFKGMTAEQRRRNRFNVALGMDRHGRRSAKCMIDEMRISRVVQYKGRFKPHSFSRNYGPNARRPSVANGPALLFDPRPVSIPLDFGSRKYVFIDDAILETKTNAVITMNHPYDKQPIVTDFKIRKSAWRPSVFDVDGQIFMPIPEGYGSEEGYTFLAVSSDGLHFTMKGRIIPDTSFYGAFFKDLNPAVPASEKYKVNAFVANRGMYFYVSGDGINWRRNETIQLPLRSGGEGECFWDDQRGRYASYIKRDSSFDDPECTDVDGRVAVGFWTNQCLKPWPFHHLRTPYFEGYPFPSVTCEGPISFDITEAGEVYRTRAIKYPWAPDVYLAFIWRYPGNDGPRHIDLGVSRNGQDWSFFGTNWYIPPGSGEEELAIYGLIRRGNEIWQYVDEGGAHGGDAERTYYRYKQRLDGFVSLDAGDEIATATTLPLKFRGDRLTLNTKASGWIKVAVADENGKPIRGFGFDDCNPIKGDFIDRTVTWKSGRTLGALRGKTVRLKFQMQNAKLFALQFTD